MVIQLLPFNSHAETDLRDVLSDYLQQIKYEYAYYANLNDDGNDFPAAREQEIIAHIENNFLINHVSDALLIGRCNILIYPSSIAVAKLFLHYGGNVLEGGEYNCVPIISVARQRARYEIPRNLSHAEVMDMIKQDKMIWNYDAPSNNSIALIKLYHVLGADIHAINKKYADNYNAIIASLYRYHVPYERRSYDIRPSYTHRADDLEPPYIPEAEADEAIYYYRSPVTYWLEKFIEADYPVSMLDTHRLHYPRFMKEASVAEVMDMLNNSDAHKISANINCPYQRKQGAGDEVAQAVSPAELCPLIPSVNMRDAMGRTPLHIAGEQGNQAVFNALINIGADESIKDYRGNLAKI